MNRNIKPRTLGEKESYKHLGILEAGNIKQAEMKKTIRKVFFGRTRKLLETIETWANPPCKILRTILKRNKGGIQTEEPKDKEIDDYTQGVRAKR